MTNRINLRTSEFFLEVCNEWPYESIKQSIKMRIECVWNRTIDFVVYQSVRESTVHLIKQMELREVSEVGAQIYRRAGKFFDPSGIVGRTYQPELAQGEKLLRMKTEYTFLFGLYQSLKEFLISTDLSSLNEDFSIESKQDALIVLVDRFTDLLARTVVFESEFKNAVVQV